MPLPPTFARFYNAIPWNVHSIRIMYLFVSCIYVITSSSPVLEYGTNPAPAAISPQLSLFVTKCQQNCAHIPFECSTGCMSFCQASISPYYKQLWPQLPSICDSRCVEAKSELCSGSKSCDELCKDQAYGIMELRGGSSPTPASTTSIRVLDNLGPTFWSTLLLIPLAAADIMISLIKIGPYLKATETEIYNNRYSLFDKVIHVLESPQFFLMAATVAFELKCLMFDDSDGYGLGITIVLQLIVLGLQWLQFLYRRFVSRARVDDSIEGKLEAQGSIPQAIPVAASPRLSTPCANVTRPPMGQSI